MGKSKKGKAHNQAPDMLLWEVAFEFVSPLSLDECSSRLQAINTDKVFLSPTRKAFLSSVESHRILFHLSEPGGRLGEGWAVGYLEGLSEDSTQVSGKVGISPEIIFLLFGLGLAGLFLILILFRSFGAFLFLAVLMGTLVYIVYHGVRYIRTNLVNEIKRILEST